MHLNKSPYIVAGLDYSLLACYTIPRKKLINKLKPSAIRNSSPPILIFWMTKNVLSMNRDRGEVQSNERASARKYSSKWCSCGREVRRWPYSTIVGDLPRTMICACLATKQRATPARVSTTVSAHCLAAVSREWCTKRLLLLLPLLPPPAALLEVPPRVSRSIGALAQ